MSWISWRKEESIFCIVYFVRKKFFKICVLSHCVVYWMDSPNTDTFTYQKALLHRLFWLFLKSLKTFNVSLSLFQNFFEKHGTFIMAIEKHDTFITAIEKLMLFTLFKMDYLPTFSCDLFKRRNYPSKTCWLLVLTLLLHWCKIKGTYLNASPKLLNLNQEHRSKKQKKFGKILIKLRLW